MTTNESSKWGDLRDDVADGLVWKATRADVVGWEEREREESRAKWPVAGKWVVVVTRDGEIPAGSRQGQNGHAGLVSVGRVGYEGATWEKVTSLAEVENVYDLGFLENLREVFVNRD